MFNFKKKVLLCTSILTIVSLLSACSISKEKAKPSEDKNNSSIIENQGSTGDNKNSSNGTTNNSIDNGTSDDIALLKQIKTLAGEGKVINSEFPAKSTVIEDIEKKLGKPDKTDWIATAKGTYATYPKENLAFGFNKGSQIFEVRSFDSKIKQISLSKVKEIFGTPDYNVKVAGEEILGYVAGKEFKLLLVFPEPTNENSNPVIDHYSVLYPQGTVNSMADDPGRQW